MTHVAPGQDGISLAAWFAAPPDSRQPAALHVAHGLIAAVERLHAAGEVHGALSPETCRIAASGQVLLVGARGRTPTLPTRAASFLPATPGPGWDLYLAPEQLRGERPTRRSDFFLLGLLLHKIRTGDHPFTAATRGEAMAAVLFRSVADATPLVARCLEKRPRRRRLLPLPGRAPAPGVPAAPTRERQAAAPVARARDAAASVARPAAAAAPGVHPAPKASDRRDAWTYPRRIAPVCVSAEPVAGSGVLAGTGGGRHQALRRVVLAVLALVVAAGGVAFAARRSRDKALAADAGALAALAGAGHHDGAFHAALASARARHGDLAVFDRLAGDFLCTRHRAAACARAYTVAVTKDSSLAADTALTASLAAQLDQPLSRDAFEAVTAAMARLPAADAELVKRVQSAHPAVRWNAVAALEALGKGGSVDYVAAYALDLRSAECHRRRRAAEQLGALGDPRALAALSAEAARVDHSVFERLCIGDAVQHALDQLGPKP